MKERISLLLAIVAGLALLLLPIAIHGAEFEESYQAIVYVVPSNSAASLTRSSASLESSGSAYALQLTSTPAFTISLPLVLKPYTPCSQGPVNPPSSERQDLDEEAADWGVYCEGLPMWVKENVTTPAIDGKALRCSITGGAPYSNVHCYRNLLSEPMATEFILTLRFMFSPSTSCNNQGTPSRVQALEFSMSKWVQFKRYEFALQWQNVEDSPGDGAPQWRYWDPQQHESRRWMPMSPLIIQCLEGEQWHTFSLEGEIVDENVHYQRFCIDSNCYDLDITVSPADELKEPDRLAVAIQLDGNFKEAPYDVFIDEVSFDRKSAVQAY